MRHLVLIAFFGLLWSGSVSGQAVKPFPIPSYQISLDEWAVFCEQVSPGISDDAKAKRDGIVKIYSKNPENPGCSATVLWYSLDGLDNLGPYPVLCGETLVVEIDERAWGVYVESEANIEVDVWIE